MQLDKLAAVISGARPGQKFSLNFKMASSTEVKQLILMARTGMVTVNPGDMALLSAVARFGWQHDRTITVTVSEKEFDSEHFASRLWRGLDSCRKL